ncbi:dephospho-CoA kinase [Breznakiellaceae bacterium SP9]
MQKLIGLTGMYCAGKNYAAAILERLGLPVLDVDKLGHEAIKAETETIVKRFGTSILLPDENDSNGRHIDRALLGKIVFGKPNELRDLENIIHPKANELSEEWLRKQADTPCVINAALLHRSVLFKRLDCIIIVKASYLTRLLRARKRDKLPISALIKRFHSQRHFNTQYLAQKTDIYKVYNDNYFGLKSWIMQDSVHDQLNKILVRFGIG